ncbi:manganese and iron superoxide dismutase [Xylona heveae TC161]|uniref:Manganese and iron superoxide dismutase n=1 Tax=Xylona heveae (strain CBS 132557 / TC161) TaxID=1328760 RepID=A0A165IF44_XYLHT|nr:manganese and iron superoxide dismutase [Xylona heveae TC161]KZF24805.1 manganese and iron superoxide dismutase [Xylona heveae TC161]
MLLQRLTRATPRALNPSIQRPIISSSAPQCRRIHHVPPLTHDASFKTEGVPSLFSAEGFDLAWTQYQRLMVEKLNLLTGGTPDENATTKTLLLTYARQSDMASLFNHASMAHNNHFFFNCLVRLIIHISPKSTIIPKPFADKLAEDFSSVETFRQEFIATANAMFGPGFVWLVKTEDHQLRILTTYLAGSPYPGAHWRRQPVDMTNQSIESAGGLSGADYARQTTVQNKVGKIGSASGQPREPAPGGINLTPLLCVNTWEHVWLRDWGIGGKRAFLEAWWDKIDWEVVYNNSDTMKGRKVGLL